MEQAFKSKAILIGLVTLTSTFIGASAQALEMQPILPTTLAIKAATISVENCAKIGNSVTATIINPEGNIIVIIRNQSSGPHTIENSFNKAFTSVSFGRAYNYQSTKAIIENTKPGKGIGEFPLPASPLKGLSYSIGGVNILSNGKLIGAIGVSGSPNGELDEKCAYDGINAIKAQIN